jgi:hypothetical protein
LDDRGGGRLDFPPPRVEPFSPTVFPFVELAASSVFFLWARQQSGHRHSTTKSPLSPRRRVKRQPNCALISV